jgi:putative sigma-54 modulation protein
MQIDIKGRNAQVTNEIRAHVEKRFAKVAKQVSELAHLEVELIKERNPAISESEVAEVTLHLKGATLRASDRSRDMTHSINMCEEELARQVKRNRDKRRRRREARSARDPRAAVPEAPGSASPAI